MLLISSDGLGVCECAYRHTHRQAYRERVPVREAEETIKTQVLERNVIKKTDKKEK